MNRRRLLAIASVLTLAGCGGGGTPSTDPTPPPAAAYTATLLHESAMPGSIAYAVSADGAVQGGWTTTGFAGGDRAAIWRGTPASAVVFLEVDSEVTGVDGDSQVGYAGSSSSANALLWRGTPESKVSLHPSGFENSMANAVSGNIQVGEGTLDHGNIHALLWRGTAASVVDLHPAAGFDFSIAYGAGGDTQVGYASVVDFTHAKAMLWRGTAASAVNLHPSGYRSSVAVAADGEFQAGHAFLDSGGQAHAMLWKGTAASAIDLHPSGFQGSYAHGARGSRQVGYATTSDGKFHAMVWSGTAASASDLHAALAGLTLGGVPLNLTGSVASGIDANGNIVGRGSVNVTVGGATSIKYYAILWKKNP